MRAELHAGLLTFTLVVVACGGGEVSSGRAGVRGGGRKHHPTRSDDNDLGRPHPESGGGELPAGPSALDNMTNPEFPGGPISSRVEATHLQPSVRGIAGTAPVVQVVRLSSRR